jgi:hypothetical protein
MMDWMGTSGRTEAFRAFNSFLSCAAVRVRIFRTSRGREGGREG